MNNTENENASFLKPLDGASSLPENVVFAIALNFLWTGLGHLLLKQVKKGITLIVLYLFISILGLAGIVFIFPFLFWIGFWIWGMYDAYKIGKQMEVEKNKLLEIEKNAINAVQFAAEIEKLHKLWQASVIGEVEYELKKDKLISSLKQRKVTDTEQDFLLGMIKLVDKSYLTKENIESIKLAMGNKN